MAPVVAHKVHPKCECGRSLFMWMGKEHPVHNKPAPTGSPYAFCRNSACALYGEDQAADQREAAPKAPKRRGRPPKNDKTGASPKAKNGSKAKAKNGSKAKAKNGSKAKAQPVAEQRPLCEDCGRVKCQCEEVDMSPAITTARRRIRKALKNTSPEVRQNLIGLALALLAQDTGATDAGAMLIEKLNLAEYGINSQGAGVSYV